MARIVPKFQEAVLSGISRSRTLSAV